MLSFISYRTFSAAILHFLNTNPTSLVWLGLLLSSATFSANRKASNTQLKDKRTKQKVYYYGEAVHCVKNQSTGMDFNFVSFS